MVESLGWAELEVRPSFSPTFERDINARTGHAMTSAGTVGGSRYGDAAGRSLVSRFSSHAATAAKIGAGILVGAGYAAFRLGQSSYAEAIEAQKVGRLTAAVIESTGGAAKVTAAEVANLSETLSQKTGVDDEIIQRGANMLLTFKNVRNEVGKNNDIFTQGLEITEDFAASMAGGKSGQLDLKSSSILVGKALNDPIKGITALTRVGVTFTEGQKKQIEGFVEGNKLAEAQKVVLKELQSEFGGAAEAQANLGDKVSVTWGNIQERIGTAALPLVRDFQHWILRDALPAAERFSDWFRKDGVPAVRDFVRKAKPEIRDFIDQAKPLAEEVIPAVATALGAIRDVAKDALPYAKGIVEAFNDMPEWAQKGLVVGGAGALAGNKLGLLGNAGGGVTESLTGSVFDRLKPMPVFVTNPGFGSGIPGAGGKGPGVVPTGLGILGTLLGGVGLTGGTYFDKSGGGAEHGFPGLGADNVGPYEGPLPVQLMGGKIDAMTRGMIAGVTDYKSSVDGLPKRLVTEFVAPGLVENREDALALVKQFELTPKEKRTFFKTVGIPLVKRETNDVLDLYMQANNTYTGHVNVNTGDVEARLNRILAAANAINRLGPLQVAGVLPGGSPSNGGGSPRRTGGRTERRHTKVYIGEREFDGVIEERIDTYSDLAEERGRAGARP